MNSAGRREAITDDDSTGRHLLEVGHLANFDMPSNCRIRDQLDTCGGETGIQKYYFLDTRGTTEHGTALHRLVASNFCTWKAIESFVQNMMHHTEWFINDDINQQQQQSKSFVGLPPPPTIRQQNSMGATALHVAVYRNALDVDKSIKALLECDQSLHNESSSPSSLAGIPMNDGSYPLHIMTGYNLTIKGEALIALVQADPTVVMKENSVGDNALSLLWKNTLRFRWAISIMKGSTYIDYITEENHCSWMTITTPSQFIRYTKLLIKAALGKGKDGSLTIHQLSSLPRCPPMLLKFAMSSQYNSIFGVQGSVHTMDAQGMLPIHHAVQSVPVNYNRVPDYLEAQYHKSLVEVLLEAYPEGARVYDSRGRLPIHYALESGYVQEFDLMRLVELHPDSLRVQDPLSGLYPFMLVSSFRNHTRQPCNAILSFPEPKSCSSVCIDAVDLDNDDQIMKDNHTEWKKDNVRMSYFLLSFCPEAIQYQGGAPGENECK
jgi:hypothetical protein